MIQKILGVRFRAIYIGCDDGSEEGFFKIQDRNSVQRVEIFNPTKRNIKRYYERVRYLLNIFLLFIFMFLS
jgi:hypothetical protein